MTYPVGWEYTDSWQSMAVLGILLLLVAIAVFVPRRFVRPARENPLTDLQRVSAIAAEADVPVELCSGRGDAAIVQPQDAAALEIARSLIQRGVMADAPVCQSYGSASLYCMAEAMPELEQIPHAGRSPHTGISFGGASTIDAALEATRALQDEQARALIQWGDTPIANLLLTSQNSTRELRIVGAVNPADGVLLAASADRFAVGEDIFAFRIEQDEQAVLTTELIWHDLAKAVTVAIIVVASLLATL